MTAGTPAQADEPEIPVRLVQLWLCDLCLDGKGGECHSPGCSLWLNRAPDLSLRETPMVTVLDGEQQSMGEQRPSDAAAARNLNEAINAEPQPAPELTAAMAETRELRELLAEVIDSFVKTSDGYRARVGQVQIAKWHKRGGLPA